MFPERRNRCKALHFNTFYFYAASYILQIYEKSRRTQCPLLLSDSKMADSR